MQKWHATVSETAPKGYCGQSILPKSAASDDVVAMRVWSSEDDLQAFESVHADRVASVCDLDEHCASMRTVKSKVHVPTATSSGHAAKKSVDQAAKLQEQQYMIEDLEELVASLKEKLLKEDAAARRMRSEFDDLLDNMAELQETIARQKRENQQLEHKIQDLQEEMAEMQSRS